MKYAQLVGKKINFSRRPVKMDKDDAVKERRWLSRRERGERLPIRALKLKRKIAERSQGYIRLSR